MKKATGDEKSSWRRRHVDSGAVAASRDDVVEHQRRGSPEGTATTSEDDTRGTAQESPDVTKSEEWQTTSAGEEGPPAFAAGKTSPPSRMFTTTPGVCAPEDFRSPTSKKNDHDHSDGRDDDDDVGRANESPEQLDIVRSGRSGVGAVPDYRDVTSPAVTTAALSGATDAQEARIEEERWERVDSNGVVGLEMTAEVQVAHAAKQGLPPSELVGEKQVGATSLLAPPERYSPSQLAVSESSILSETGMDEKAATASSITTKGSDVNTRDLTKRTGGGEGMHIR